MNAIVEHQKTLLDSYYAAKERNILAGLKTILDPDTFEAIASQPPNPLLILASGLNIVEINIKGGEQEPDRCVWEIFQDRRPLGSIRVLTFQEFVGEV